MAAQNLFQQYLQPPKSALDYTAEMDANDLRREQLTGTRQKNALDALVMRDTLDQRQSAAEDRNALQRLAAGWNAQTTDEQRAVDLLNSGRPALAAQADALRKGSLERKKTEAQAAKDTADATKTRGAALDDALKRYRGGLDFIDTPQGAARWVAAQYQDPLTGEHLQRLGPVEQLIARIPQDPAGFQQWRQQAAVGMDKFIDNQRQAAQQAETVRHNKAGEGLTARGQDLTDARTREAGEAAVTKPFEVTDPTTGQPTLVRQDKAGNITPVPGYQPKGMGTTKLTEDQGKATGWLAQATNAYANMQSAMKSTPSAAKPGFNDAVAKVPLVGEGLANTMRGSDRQKYMQATSSLSEALLRAATGAGVNKEEAAQKVRELTPQFGEGDDVIKQKMDAIPVYLESLKVRAGPGAKQIPGIFERAKPGEGNKPSVSNW